MGEVIQLPVRHDPLLSKKQLAAMWRCSTRTIERYRNAGMPAEWRDGRWGFRLSLCEAWRQAERKVAHG